MSNLRLFFPSYQNGVKGYMLYGSATKKSIISIYVVFYDKSMLECVMVEANLESFSEKETATKEVKFIL